MINITKDFTIIQKNSKRKHYGIKNIKQTDNMGVMNNLFNNSLNKCKGVIMKKHHIIIQM